MEYNSQISQKEIKKPKVGCLVKIINTYCKIKQREQGGRHRECQKTSKLSTSGRKRNNITAPTDNKSQNVGMA